MIFRTGDLVNITEDRDGIGVKTGEKGKITGLASDESYWVRFAGKSDDVIVPESILVIAPPVRALSKKKKRSAEEHRPDSTHGTSETFTKPPIRAFIESPNHSSRNGVSIRRVILHYTTAGTVDGTIEWFKNPASQVSAHYIIDRNGFIYQMVRDSDKAWHAKGDNIDSIGIEHVARKGENLAPDQDRSSIALIKWILSEYKIPKSQITGHRFTPSNINSTDCPDALFGARTEVALRSWVDRNFV